jgi:aminoglycoside phosphotransferase (APT) family kinase protein
VPVPVATDDIVPTWADAGSNGRAPLIVLEPLLEFLDANGLGSGDATLEPIGDGRSNVTYLVRRGDATFVLRRPPRPPWPPSAHNVVREARVLRALEGRARVPRVHAVCDTDTVIGAPFYAMEWIEGDVITDRVPEGLNRRATAESLVDALVELHDLDWRAAGLEDLGKPQGYLERQLGRFQDTWEHNKTREIHAVESVAAWLQGNLPVSPAATLVHGDYRLGNAVVRGSAVVAILDWEMATIGDPLADLGYLCAMWSDPSDGEVAKFEPSPATRQRGFLPRGDLVARYEQRSGRPMTDVRWYQTLALWKAAVFMEGNYRRAVSGATDDAFLASFGDGVLQLADRAEALALGAR